MQEKTKVAIFGGSFNPPLNSHINLAKKIIEQNIAGEIIFVPVNSKYNKQGLISNEHRYNMLKLCCEEGKNLSVSRIEIDSERQLYTIETLEKIQKNYPEKEIIYVLGTDNLKSLDKWKDVQTLLSKFKIVVIQRNNDNIDQIILENLILVKYKEAFIQMGNEDYRNFSSTDARDLIGQGKEYKEFVSDKTYKYIKTNKLYTK